jgi:hypothetical protein
VGPAFLLPPSARQLSDALQLSSVSCKPRQLVRKLRTFEQSASDSTAVTPGRSSSTFPQPPRMRLPLHAPCPSPNLPAARPVAVPWTAPRAHVCSASHTHDARSQNQSSGPQQHLVPSPTTKPPSAVSHESPQDPPLRPRASPPSLCSHPPARAAQQSRPRTPSLARPPCVIPRRTAPAPPDRGFRPVCRKSFAQRLSINLCFSPDVGGHARSRQRLLLIPIERALTSLINQKQPRLLLIKMFARDTAPSADASSSSHASSFAHAHTPYLRWQVRLAQHLKHACDALRIQPHTHRDSRNPVKPGIPPPLPPASTSEPTCTETFPWP